MTEFDKAIDALMKIAKGRITNERGFNQRICRAELREIARRALIDLGYTKFESVENVKDDNSGAM